MIDLEKLLKQWEEDSKIDKLDLVESSIKCASLHSKYLELYSKVKLSLKDAEFKYAELRKNKWLWYNGKLSKEEIDTLGWKYDPFNGLNKPLKNEMDIFFDADPDIIKYKTKIEYLNTILETLKEIIDTIKWRHQTIKNIIDFLKFTNGM